MGQILHKNAKTTIKVREEIQNSKESGYKLAKKFGLNVKTIYKWRKKESVFDSKSGVDGSLQSVLTIQEQQIICEIRKLTFLSQSDLLVALKPYIPTLTRSNLSRLLIRNKLNKVPKEVLEHKKFKDYKPGFIHIDSTEIRIKKDRFVLFVAIDRATRFIFTKLFEQKTMENSRIFLEEVLKEFPFKIQKILTDNGSEFTYQLLPEKLRPKKKLHFFDEICKREEIEHRLTKFKSPWTNGMVERANRRIKEATTYKFFYETKNEFEEHLSYFLIEYNFHTKLPTIRDKTPYEKILEYFEKEPSLFSENPNQKKWGGYILLKTSLCHLC